MYWQKFCVDESSVDFGHNCLTVGTEPYTRSSDQTSTFDYTPSQAWHFGAIATKINLLSLIMFAAVVLDPFSQAISGALLEINSTGLFVAAGTTMLVTTCVALLSQASGTSSLK